MRSKMHPTAPAHESIPGELVAGTHAIFYAGSGTGGSRDAWVEIRASARDLRLHFLTPNQVPATGPAGTRSTASRLSLDKLPPTELTPAKLLAMARRERPPLRSGSWVDLYRQAVLREPAMFALINIEGASVEDTRARHALAAPDVMGNAAAIPFHPETLSLDEMVRKHGRVLLTAPAGGGKTTLLVDMLRRHMSNPHDSLKQTLLPFRIRLKDVGRSAEAPNVAQWVARSVRECLNRRLDIRDLLNVRFPRAQRVLGERKLVQMTKAEILERIGHEVERWFDTGDFSRHKPLLLLDGYNEAPYHCRQDIEKALKHLIEKDFFFVLTSRNDNVPSLLTPLPEFRLQELSKQQIIFYLDQWFPADGERIFDTFITTVQRTLSMARNPFFLKLMAQWIQMNPGKPIPVTHGQLMKHFVEKCAYRKRTTDELHIARIPSHVNNTVLGKLAYVMLRKTTSGLDQELARYPQDIQDQFVEGYRLHKILDVAEAEGLLSKTGAEDFDVSEDFEFLHDYFLYYFAAQHLQSLSRAGLLADRLQHYSEYVDWDIPLALFFELATDADANAVLLRKLQALDNDLAVICGIRAKLSEEFILELARSSVTHQDRNSSCIPQELSPEIPPIAALLGRLPSDTISELIHERDTPEALRFAARLAFQSAGGASAQWCFPGYP
jgi:hypothetical protein